MSISREITIWCDICSNWKQFSSGKIANVSAARRELKAQGWSVSKDKWEKGGIKDFCPLCTVKILEEKK